MIVRLVKFLSDGGVASRRRAGELVKNGEVTVDGVVERDPARRVGSENTVCFRGERVSPAEQKYYIALNKPAGYVCSSSDVHAEKLAVELIDIPGRFFSAGRLDKESEGLIIFSNDGGYIDRLTHPRYEVHKTYRVTTLLPVSDEKLARIREGVENDGEVLHVVSVERAGGRDCIFVLNEGKKREIRRICAEIGCPVLRLKRIKVGSFELDSIPEGKYRLMTPEEVAKSLQNPLA